MAALEFDFHISLGFNREVGAYYVPRGGYMNDAWLSNKTAQDQKKFEAKREEDKRFSREQELKLAHGRQFWGALKNWLQGAAEAYQKQFGADVIFVSEQGGTITVAGHFTRGLRTIATITGSQETNMLGWTEGESGVSQHVYQLELVGDSAVLAVNDTGKKTPEDLGKEILEYVTKG